MALSHINSVCFGFRCGNLMGNQAASPQNPRDRDISASLKCEGQVRLRWPHKGFLLRWDPVSLQAMQALRSSANSECELPRRASPSYSSVFSEASQPVWTLVATGHDNHVFLSKCWFTEKLRKDYRVDFTYTGFLGISETVLLAHSFLPLEKATLFVHHWQTICKDEGHGNLPQEKSSDWKSVIGIHGRCRMSCVRLVRTSAQDGFKGLSIAIDEWGQAFVLGVLRTWRKRWGLVIVPGVHNGAGTHGSVFHPHSCVVLPGKAAGDFLLSSGRNTQFLVLPP